MAMQAGYGKLRNDCARPVAVVAARSPLYADVSLHETVQVDGVSRMREVERLGIGPGKEIVLQPGGLHLMLMQPAGELELDQKVPLRLLLADGDSLEVELQVRRDAP
jgi:copper(I)-binding protein